MTKNVISLIGDEGGEVFEMRSPLFAFIQSTGVVTTITWVTTVMMINIEKNFADNNKRTLGDVFIRFSLSLKSCD